LAWTFSGDALDVIPAPLGAMNMSEKNMKPTLHAMSDL
jgi:hypothetical protein